MQQRIPFILAAMVGLFLANGASANTNMTTQGENMLKTATFGGGCFWCTEAVFQMLPGVKKVVSGYAGGQTENPTYKEVCNGTTGHAEVIQITYDPAAISYEKLVDNFWEAHDPTTLNRQGADEGTQYRSIILYETEAERAAAEKSKATAQKNFKSPIVTEIVPLKKFYAAEGYHQDYYQQNPNQGYCRVVIAPKVEKFKKKLKQAPEAK
jgi:peptide-methionine (S)-S-oxide reductase